MGPTSAMTISHPVVNPRHTTVFTYFVFYFVLPCVENKFDLITITSLMKLLNFIKNCEKKKKQYKFKETR